MNQGYFEVIRPFTMLMLTANIKSILFWVLGQVPGKYWNSNIYTILVDFNPISSRRADNATTLLLSPPRTYIPSYDPACCGVSRREATRGRRVREGEV